MNQWKNFVDQKDIERHQIDLVGVIDSNHIMLHVTLRLKNRRISWKQWNQ